MLRRIRAPSTGTNLSQTLIQSHLNTIVRNDTTRGSDENYNLGLDSVQTESQNSSATDESDHELHRDINITKFNHVSLLREWAVIHNISHPAIKDLLEICRGWLPFCGFPVDPRSLLQTQRNVELENVGGGQFYHFGLEKGILGIINATKGKQVSFKKIEISLGIDGLPISKSSNLQFWPILCKLNGNLWGGNVFIVSLFCGNQKPKSIEEFLNPLANELNSLKQNGIEVYGKNLKFVLKAIIADAPARAFIKQIKSHNAYFACERCYFKGEFYGRVIYPVGEKYPLHSDESFKSKAHINHHEPNKMSPLVNADVGMISQIPLDYMHLCCLGVMKKLLILWIEGPIPHRLSQKQINLISNKLLQFRNRVPSHFSRKPRSLSEVKHWKATEFRNFLLYLGPMCLKGVLSTEKYHHFLLLHTSIYVLASNFAKYQEWVDLSGSLIDEFVEKIPLLYCKEFLVFNVHSLTHLAGDVLLHGPLDDFSAFPFENFMQVIKRLLRSKNSPLSQMVRRLSEINAISTSLSKHVENSSLTPSAKLGDNCFITKTGQVCVVEKYRNQLMCRVFGDEIQPKSYPVQCKGLGMGFVRNLGTLRKLDPENLSKKCILLPCGKKYFYISLCNSYETNRR